MRKLSALAFGARRRSNFTIAPRLKAHRAQLPRRNAHARDGFPVYEPSLCGHESIFRVP
jgi:hypothetical protein